MHACQVDQSPDTGALVSCTCGFALGPFQERATALDIARQHRRAHEGEKRPRPPTQTPETINRSKETSCQRHE